MLFRLSQRALRAHLLLVALLFGAPVHAATADRLETVAVQTAVAANALLLDITLAGTRLVAVGEQGIVLLSDDQGQSWQQVEVPVSVMLTAVSFIDAKLGWAVGHDGAVLKTTDGGDSWQLALTAREINALRVDQLEPIWAQASANNSVDAEHLQQLEYALDDARVAQDEDATPPLLDVWFRNSREGYIVGAYGLFLHTRDGGESWQSLGHQLPNPDGFHLNALLESVRGDLYITGEAGIVMRLQHGGERWQLLDSPYDGSFFALVEHDRLYLMGLRGHLFSSTDGEQWQQEVLPHRATLNAAVTDGQRLLILGQGGLLLQQSAAGFIDHKAALKRTLIAGVISGDSLVLVGDGGVKTVALGEGENES